MDAFVGEVRIFSFNWAPVDWAFCDGSIVSMQQYTALWAVIGNAFGGNLQQHTFALPNLRASAAIGAGAGTNLTNRPIAGAWGENQVTLNSAQLPSHNHGLTDHVTTIYADMSPAPVNPSWISRLVSQTGTATSILQAYSKGATSAPDTTMCSQSVGISGSNGAHENRQPLLAMNFCIATTGFFPPRP